MHSFAWLALATLVAAWVRVRFWNRLGREIPALRAERYLATARVPLLIEVAAFVVAGMLAAVWPLLMGRAEGAGLDLPTLAPLALPALLLAAGAIGRPARARVLGETWGLGAWLLYPLRLVVAFLAGWLVLLVLPTLGMGLDPPLGWLAPPLAAVLALAWVGRQGAVAAWALDAGPLADAAQSAACEALLANPDLRPDGRRVRLAAAGHPGGGLVNAIAFPGEKDCHVLFGRRLLALLDGPEAAAICAHELAHLEHRDRRWVRRLRTGAAALALGGTGLAWLAPAAGASPWWPMPAWVVTCLLLLALLQRHQRREEAACDARALALGADPEALASALIKLHRAVLIPRRMAAAADQALSHPSLARRLQAIRRLAGLAEPPDPATLAIPSGDGWLHLDGEAMERRPGPPAPARPQAAPAWRKPFSDLIEVYLSPSRKGATLVLGDGAGAPLRLPLARADCPAVQAHLDRVDHRLAPLPERRLGPGRQPIWIGLAIVLAMAMAGDGTLTLFQRLLLIGCVVPVLIGGGRGGLAVAGAWAAGLALDRLLELAAFASDRPDPQTLVALLVLAAGGLWALWLALVPRGREVPICGRSLAAWSALLVGAGLLAWLGTGLRPWDGALPAGLADLGGERASLLLPLLALGALLAAAGRRARVLGAALAVGALGALIASAPAAYQRWAPATGRDPLAGPLPALPAPGAALKIEERPLPGWAQDLELSADGRHFAATLSPAGDTRGTGDADGDRWVLGSLDGPLHVTQADDLAFCGPGWLLARRVQDRTDLELWDGGAAENPVWTLPLPLPRDATELALWIDEDRWQLARWDPNGDMEWLGAYTGRIGAPEWRFQPPKPESDLDPEPDLEPESEPDSESGPESNPESEPDANPASGGCPREPDCAWGRDPGFYCSNGAPWTLRVEMAEGRLPHRGWRAVLARRSQVVELTLTGPDGQERRFFAPGSLYCLDADPTHRRLCLAHRGGERSRRLGIWTFDHASGRFVPRLGGPGDLLPIFTGDGGLVLLDRAGRVVGVDRDGEPTAVSLPGGPLDELRIAGGIWLGLRDSDTGTGLVRVLDGAARRPGRPVGQP